MRWCISGLPSSTQFNCASYDNHGLPAKMQKERSMEAFSAVSSSFVEGKLPVDSEYWENTGRNSNSVADANKVVQVLVVSFLNESEAF